MPYVTQLPSDGARITPVQLEFKACLLLLTCPTIFHTLSGESEPDAEKCVSVSCSPYCSCHPGSHPSQAGPWWPQQGRQSWLFSLPPPSASEFHQRDVTAALDLFYREILRTESALPRGQPCKTCLLTVLSSHSSTKCSPVPRMDEAMCVVLG